MKASPGSNRRSHVTVLLLASILVTFALPEASHVPSLSTMSWDAIGPGPVNTPGVAQGFSAGRVEAAAPHPTNPDVMYIGADGGGVWKTATWNRSSADGGPIWLALTDDQPSLDFSGYHPLIVIAGPGGRDTVLGAVSGIGAGILKSVSGGLSWQLLGNAILDGASIQSIAAERTNLKVLYIAIRWGGPGGGVYKSMDGGSTWQNTTLFHTGGATDVIMDPFDSDVLYAGLADDVVTAGVYRTDDGGTTWSVMTGLPSGFFLGRTVRLEAAQSEPNIVYATIFEEDLNAGLLVNHYRTGDGGGSWDKLTTPGGDPEERSWHVLLGVSPTGADHVFVGRAYQIFESVDGGQTWAPFGNVEDDWVNMAVDAANRPVMTADRNLYSYDPSSASLDSREGNLQVTEFYTNTVDPQDPERVYGVSQDHLHAMTSSGSVEWAYMPQGGGEVGKVLVHPANSSLLYVSHPLAPAALVQRSTDGGQHWTTILTTTDFDKEDYELAYTVQGAFVMDPTNPSRLLLGTTKVLETANAESGSPTWTDFSPVLSTSADVSQQYITALATSADGQSVYAATADGHVWVKHPGKFWEQRDAGLFGLGAGRVEDFSVDPSNPFRAYAVTNGPGGNNIWLLTQQGKSYAWANISGDFPTNLASTTIFVEWQYNPDSLYVGSNRGLYHSVNLGQNWSKLGPNLPNAIVTDLQYQPTYSILSVGTYGRGVWQILLGASTISGQVYWDQNADGSKDLSEGGLASVKVYLDVNGSATHDAFERSAFSDSVGNFVLNDVPPGTYTLRQVTPPGFLQTTPTWSNLVVNGSNPTGLDIGNTKTLALKPEVVQKLLQKFTLKLERKLENPNENSTAARSYSPKAFGPGEPRVTPGAAGAGKGRPGRFPSDEQYFFYGDLNDLPGRFPGEPVAAEGEFDGREPPPPPPRPPR